MMKLSKAVAKKISAGFGTEKMQWKDMDAQRRLGAIKTIAKEYKKTIKCIKDAPSKFDGYDDIARRPQDLLEVIIVRSYNIRRGWPACKSNTMCAQMESDDIMRIAHAVLAAGLLEENGGKGGRRRRRRRTKKRKSRKKRRKSRRKRKKSRRRRR
jgi:hypothetical protein